MSVLTKVMWFAVLAFALSPHAQAVQPAPATTAALERARAANAACLACHAVGALNHLPKPDLNVFKLSRLLHDPAAYDTSVHGRLACTKCHEEGYEAHPHTGKPLDLAEICSDCHAKRSNRINAEFDRSVHARRMHDRITCITCHDPHAMRIAKQEQDPARIVAQGNRVCLGCHDSDQTFARYAPERKQRPDIDEIHKWLPNARLHWRAVRCVECHTPASKDTLSHQILDKSRAEKKCVACHSVNSALNARLYRHLVEEEHRKMGFLNSVILGNSYVISATRHPVIDGVLIALVTLTLIGVVLHGLLRFIASRRRRGKQHE